MSKLKKKNNKNITYNHKTAVSGALKSPHSLEEMFRGIHIYSNIYCIPSSIWKSTENWTASFWFLVTLWAALEGIVWRRTWELGKKNSQICRQTRSKRWAKYTQNWGTLPKTNSSPLKIGHPKRKLGFQPSIFRCHVSFREGNRLGQIRKHVDRNPIIQPWLGVNSLESPSFRHLPGGNRGHEFTYKKET